jgi:hypothetical protein
VLHSPERTGRRVRPTKVAHDRLIGQGRSLSVNDFDKMAYALQVIV